MNGSKKTMPSGRSLPEGGQELPAAVIFDMDGTLVATTEADFRAWQRVFMDQGKALSYEDYFPLLGKKSLDVVSEGLLLEGAAAQLALHRKMEYFEEIVRKEGIVTMPAAREFLTDLNALNIPIALATSSRRMKMQLVMEEADLKHFFSVFVTGEEVTDGKPAPGIFLLAAERLGVAPELCLVLEDAVMGVAAAKAAGMKCIAITNTHEGSALSAADLVVSAFSEISLEDISACFI